MLRLVSDALQIQEQDQLDAAWEAAGLPAALDVLRQLPGGAQVCAAYAGTHIWCYLLSSIIVELSSQMLAVFWGL